MSTNNLRTINTNIKNLLAQGQKQRLLAEQTLVLILEHGKESRHYDRLPALLDACQSNQALVKDLITACKGILPHTLTIREGVYRLGKRDESLIMGKPELEKVQAAKQEQREATKEKTAAKREENNKKIEQHEVLINKIKELEQTAPIVQVKELAQAKENANKFKELAKQEQDKAAKAKDSAQRALTAKDMALSELDQVKQELDQLKANHAQLQAAYSALKIENTELQGAIKHKIAA